MPVDLLEYIGNAVQVLQDAHQKFFKNKIMGSNVINLNFFFCYCIKVYDQTTGSQEMRRWKRFIKLSTGKLAEYNRLFRLHLDVFRRHYTSMVIKTHNKTGKAAAFGSINEGETIVQQVYEFQWPEIEVEIGDLFVAESKKLI